MYSYDRMTIFIHGEQPFEPFSTSTHFWILEKRIIMLGPMIQTCKWPEGDKKEKIVNSRREMEGYGGA